MRLRRALAGVLVAAAACGGAESSDGVSFDLGAGRTLATLRGAFAGFRRARTTYEHDVGSFLITETPESDWVTASRIEDGMLLDAAGTPIGRVTVSADRIAVEALDDAMNRAFVAFACDPPADGGYLGFGAQTHDVDHRGMRVPVFVSEQGVGKVETDQPAAVWNLVGTRHQSYLAVPTMIAPRADASYGLHATTLRRSVWDLCKGDPGALRVEAGEGKLEVVVTPGATPLEVIDERAAIVGRVEAWPDWTFGVWMERVGGTQAVRDEAALLRAEKIPASAIWSEDWRGGSRVGRSYVLEEDWRWDQALYPGLPSLIRDLHAGGLKFMAYFNTFVVEGTDVWDEALRDGHLVKTARGEPYLFTEASGHQSGLAELFRPETRTWVSRELEAALALGVDGWMADFAEWYPADPRTAKTPDGSSVEDAHHRYPVEWADVNRAAARAAGRDADTVIFHRSGYTGSQGKARVIWAGDQWTSFDADDGLPTVVPIMAGLGAAGFQVVTHDIGGYISATNPPATKDLFFRWTSLGAMGPVMRTHHGRDADLNWRWSKDAETRAHFKRWADLHTRLFPLWKGLARSGLPIVRPVAFLDPGDARLHGIKDAYAIGDALLVAPVLTASTASRAVVLPRGAWFDFSSGERHEGGATITVPAPLGELPIFARAGAVIPMLASAVETLATPPPLERIEVHVWLGANGRALDPVEGEYTVESPGAPSGPLSGATFTLSEPRHLVFDAAPATAVTLTDGAGAQHRLTSARRATTWHVRW